MNKDTPAIEGGKKTRKNFLLFAPPLIGKEEIAEVVDTLRSGWLTTGPKAEKFENLFKAYVKSKHAIAVNSGTNALSLAVNVAGINPGDEVITTPMTFSATANSIIHHGGKPVFVDIEVDSRNINPGLIEAKITKNTKAIMPVHFAGIPCDMDPIIEIAKKYNLIVIEDAAHAIETAYKGKKVGSISKMTCFSFYATKNVTTGEGGMVTTDDDTLAETIRVRSMHGISKSAWKRYSAEGFKPYDTLYPGFKYNLTDILAGIGIHQLKKVEKNLKVREKLWKRYNKNLKDIDCLILPAEKLKYPFKHGRHLYTVLLKLEMLKVDRNQFVNCLKEEGIGTGIQYTALNTHSVYQKMFGYKRGDFLNAEFVSERTISLPLTPKLTLKDIDDVSAAIKKIADYYRK
jgi:dTDP-4-amino-4,6-dideoxygalactose transaminase